MSLTPNPAPTSDARILANRENAKKSTGPRTESGKAASRRNALKHGLTAQLLLTHDQQGLHRQLLTDLYHRYQPADQVERIVVARIAFGLLRLDALIAPLLALSQQADGPEIAAGLDAPLPANAFTPGCDAEQAAFQLLSRYETRLENSVRRDIRLLESLLGTRPGPDSPPPPSIELEIPDPQPPEAAPQAPATAPPSNIISVESKSRETKPNPHPVPAPPAAKPAPAPIQTPAPAFQSGRGPSPDRPKYFIG